MKYAMSFWNSDGTIQQAIAFNVKERDDLINRARMCDIEAVTYEPIYKSGKSGNRTFILFI